MISNDENFKWLLNQRSKLLVFTGCGISFSIAEALANLFRNMGFNSFALQPVEVINNPDYVICLISRSGNTYNLTKIDFLITEAEASRVEGISANRIFVIKKSAESWLPIDFCENLVQQLTELLSLSSLIKFDFNLHYSPNNLLLIPERYRVVQYFFKYTQHKMKSFRTEVIGYSEFGHGFHKQLLDSPDKYSIYIAKSAGLCDLKLDKWLQKNDIEYKVVNLGSPSGSNELILELLLFSISYVKGWCTYFDEDWTLLPITKELDNLR